MAQGIRKRQAADGTPRYQVQWNEGGGRDGEQLSITLTVKDEARRLLAAIVANGNRLPDEHRHLLRRRGDNRAAVVTTAPVVAPEVAAAAGETFTAYAAEYVTNLTGITEGYRRQFGKDVARHMTPAFGDKPLPAIDGRLVRAWLRGLEAGTHEWLLVKGKPRPLAYRTRKRLATEAGAIMRDARRHQLVTFDPFDGVRIGTLEHTASRQEVIKALTHDEWRRLAAELPAGVYRDLALVAVGTGLRFGELTALQCRHVILDDGPPRIEVRQAWKSTRAGKGDDGERYVLGPPKSKQGTRDVTVDSTVADALRRLVAGRPAFALVFTTPATDGTHARAGGAPIRANNYAGRVWRPAVRRCWPDQLDEAGKVAEAGRRVRFHDLRHTHASWLINANRPLTEIQRRLGHSSIQLTSDTYGHLLTDPTDAAVAAIEAALAPPAEPAHLTVVA